MTAKLPALNTIDPLVLSAAAKRAAEPGPAPAPDPVWLDRLWIMPDGRPTLRKPIVRPCFDDPCEKPELFGDPVDLAKVEEGDRDVYLTDVRREAPGYLEPAAWCYLRWSNEFQIAALKAVLPFVVFDYGFVVAMDLDREVHEGTRKKLKGSIGRIANRTDPRVAFPWRAVRGALLEVGVGLRYPAVLSERALAVVMSS